ncbi:hypothetical protein HanHA300_Chr02g0044631 [Helianthus annuus]|nr:hypothetical protein HanHA300_Chr02g0044591 [Helianthus annuus]KAJ0603998.1 hypothetical protein HanHA300_Chr02g0044611 [Helianthus annuus]KAJ0604000.1 hypothetical protein HanHA300_Chr02g0044631 [Helianthus annuus]KAJ0618003.1 hypothetical protein HanHA89_Chr02g0048201 [Helianthus annuus]KAJ0618005.1 hypothetical protein HanHA89_Chr02g0048221 [Helianthus annuus]
MKLHKKCDRFSQKLIDDIRTKRCGSSSDEGNDMTFIDAMLSLQESEPAYYTDDIIKGNILVCVFIVHSLLLFRSKS